MTTIKVETNDGNILIDSSGVTITTHEHGKGIVMSKVLQDFIQSSYYLLCELDLIDLDIKGQKES